MDERKRLLPTPGAGGGIAPSGDAASDRQSLLRQSLKDYQSVLDNSLRKKLGEKAQAEKDREHDGKSNNDTLVAAFFLMLFFQLGNRIFGRLQTYPMHNYPIFMNMLSVSIYIPICFAYIIPMVSFTDVISKEQQEIPKYKFAVMGAYDSLAGIMQTFAINYISNASTIVLVQQSAIPISMAISKYALDAKYTFAQYLGSAVVLLGIVVVLIPTLLASPASSGSGSGAEGQPGQLQEQEEGPGQLLWILILIVSCVPMCLSSVYKEKALGEVDIDVVYLNGWVAVYQFLIALPLCIPSSQVIKMPVAAIVPNLWGGMLCWMGINSITAQTAQVPGSLVPLDDCSTAPLYVSTYLLFNIIFNILIVVILKHGSANIMWMASTVIVPLSNLAFSMDFMPGHKPLNSFDIVGLVVIMLGLVLYRFSDKLLSLWARWTSDESELVDEELEERSALVSRSAESRQTKFVGLNQIEGIQSLFDSRIAQAQRTALFRSPQQIKGSLLLRLGIPPSPHVQHMLEARQLDVLGKKPGMRAASDAAAAVDASASPVEARQHEMLTKKSRMPSFVELSGAARNSSFIEKKTYLQGSMSVQGTLDHPNRVRPPVDLEAQTLKSPKVNAEKAENQHVN